MNSTVTSTDPSNQTYILSDSSIPLADIERFAEITQADVLVRSKDYFVTLATKLDKLSLELKPRQRLQKDAIQQIVDELLYLQKHYEIKAR